MPSQWSNEVYNSQVIRVSASCTCSQAAQILLTALYKAVYSPLLSKNPYRFHSRKNAHNFHLLHEIQWHINTLQINQMLLGRKVNSPKGTCSLFLAVLSFGVAYRTAADEE